MMHLSLTYIVMHILVPSFLFLSRIPLCECLALCLLILWGGAFDSLFLVFDSYGKSCYKYWHIGSGVTVSIYFSRINT